MFTSEILPPPSNKYGYTASNTTAKAICSACIVLKYISVLYPFIKRHINNFGLTNEVGVDREVVGLVVRQIQILVNGLHQLRAEAAEARPITK